MTMLKNKLVAIATISTMFITALGTTEAVRGNIQEVKCDTDSSFISESCDQCFNWDKVKSGDNIAELTDKWINPSTSKLLMYEAEQKNPELKNLGWAKVKVKTNSIGGKMWTYTSELKSKFDKDLDGYVLNGGESVNWIKTVMGASYKIEKNEVASGQNVAMLIYPISTHTIREDTQEITIDTKTHKECVLYKSAWVQKEVVTDKTGKKVTPVKTSIKNATTQQTGPEMYILILMALLMGTFLLRRKA